MRLLQRSPHDRDILRLAVPALGALVAEPLYRLTDTAVVGHLGTDELAGLTIATAVLATGYAVFIFLAYGTTSAVARLIGAGEHKRAAHQAVQSLWLAVALGAGLAAVLWVVAPPLVALLGGQGAVADHTLVYLRVSLLGLPVTFVILAGTGYLRGLQDTRTPLVVAVGTAVGEPRPRGLVDLRAGLRDRGLGPVHRGRRGPSGHRVRHPHPAGDAPAPHPLAA